jgi:hypothetical protein
MLEEHRDEREDLALDALDDLLEYCEEVEPDTLVLPTERQENSVGSAPLELLEDEPDPEKSQKSPKKEKPFDAEKHKKRGIRSMKEDVVASVGEVVLERLRQWTNGIKEEVLVLSVNKRVQAKHPDVFKKQTLAVIRKLKRDGKVRYSAGRWYIV